MKLQYPRSGQVSNTAFYQSCVAGPKTEAKIGKATPNSEKPTDAGIALLGFAPLADARRIVESMGIERRR